MENTMTRWVWLLLTSQGVHYLTHSIMFNGSRCSLYLNPSLTFKTCGNLELLQEWPARRKKLSMKILCNDLYVCACVWCGGAGCAVLYAIRRPHHVAAVRRVSVVSLGCRNGYPPSPSPSLWVNTSPLSLGPTKPPNNRRSVLRTVTEITAARARLCVCVCVSPLCT